MTFPPLEVKMTISLSHPSFGSELRVELETGKKHPINPACPVEFCAAETLQGISAGSKKGYMRYVHPP